MSDSHKGNAQTPGAAARQRAHYEEIHAEYKKGYYDEWSLRYRKEFILEPLLAGLDLNKMRIADMACGDGYNSLMLKSMWPGVETQGFDVSPTACAQYRDLVGGLSHEVDLTGAFSPPDQFDGAIMIGGLHHCVSDIRRTLSNIRALVRPGGFFAMYEPNRDYFLQIARDFWYKKDKYFDAETEAALSHDALLADADGAFQPEILRYGGGIAYFLILNSLVLRVPDGIKRRISPPLMCIEALHNKLQWRRLHATFCARWRAV